MITFSHWWFRYWRNDHLHLYSVFAQGYLCFMFNSVWRSEIVIRYTQKEKKRGGWIFFSQHCILHMHVLFFFVFCCMCGLHELPTIHRSPLILIWLHLIAAKWPFLHKHWSATIHYSFLWAFSYTTPHHPFPLQNNSSAGQHMPNCLCVWIQLCVRHPLAFNLIQQWNDVRSFSPYHTQRHCLS